MSEHSGLKKRDAPPQSLIARKIYTEARGGYGSDSPLSSGTERVLDEFVAARNKLKPKYRKAAAYADIDKFKENSRAADRVRAPAAETNECSGATTSGVELVADKATMNLQSPRRQSNASSVNGTPHWLHPQRDQSDPVVQKLPSDHPKRDGGGLKRHGPSGDTNAAIPPTAVADTTFAKRIREPRNPSGKITGSQAYDSDASKASSVSRGSSRAIYDHRLAMINEKLERTETEMRLLRESFSKKSHTAESVTSGSDRSRRTASSKASEVQGRPSYRPAREVVIAEHRASDQERTARQHHHSRGTTLGDSWDYNGRESSQDRRQYNDSRELANLRRSNKHASISLYPLTPGRHDRADTPRKSQNKPARTRESRRNTRCIRDSSDEPSESSSDECSDNSTVRSRKSYPAPNGNKRSLKYASRESLPRQPAFPYTEGSIYRNGLTLHQSMSLIPTFDGNPDELNAFRQGVRAVLEAFPEPTFRRSVLLILPQKLTGRAGEGYRSRVAAYSDPEQLLADLTMQYGNVGIADEVQMEIKLLKQEPGETAGDYGLRMRKLHNRMLTIIESAPELRRSDKAARKRQADADALQHFTFGLEAPLDHQVRGEKPLTIQEAIRLAVDFEGRQKARRAMQKLLSSNTAPVNKPQPPSAAKSAAVLRAEAEPYQVSSSPKPSTDNGEAAPFDDSLYCEYCERRGHTLGDCRTIKFHLAEGKIENPTVARRKQRADKRSSPSGNATNNRGNGNNNNRSKSGNRGNNNSKFNNNNNKNRDNSAKDNNGNDNRADNKDTDNKQSETNENKNLN